MAYSKGVPLNAPVFGRGVEDGVGGNIQNMSFVTSMSFVIVLMPSYRLSYKDKSGIANETLLQPKT
jgi:hypothetical protein